MNDGIYTDLSIENYHGNTTHISSTQIKLAKRSLKEFDWYRRGLIKKEQKIHFDFGNAFECALLDEIEFNRRVAIMNDEEWIKVALEQKPELTVPRNSKAYKEQIEKFYTENAGKYLIMDKGPDSWEVLQCMLESCYQDKIVQGLIKNTEYQVSLFWSDEATGLRLKARPDICKRKKNVVVNVKTSIDGSPQAFSRDLVKYDYPLQACMEISGCLKAGLMDQVDNYFWLVVEKVPPFNATIYEFAKEDMQACMIELGYLINKVSLANEESLYPGYSDRADNRYGILRADIPIYYKAF